MIRVLLILIVGTIPAVILGFFAAFLTVFGAYSAIAYGNTLNLVAVPWGLAGIWGAYTLIRATSKNVKPHIWPGLVVGLIAIAPLFVSLSRVGSFSFRHEGWALLFVGPAIVTIYLLAELEVKRRKDKSTGT